MPSQQSKRPLRLLIIEPSDAFALSLANRLSGLEHFAVHWETVPDVQKAMELLERESFQLAAAGLPMAMPHGADVSGICARFSMLPVLGFGDSGSSMFLHPSLTENVTMVLPKSRLDNAVLEQAISASLFRSQLCADLEAAQMNLWTSQKHFENIIDKHSDGIVVVDTSGIVRFVNPRAEELFEAQAEKLVGAPFGHALVPEESLEIEIPSRNGSIKTLETRAVGSRWDFGEPALLVTLRDITKRKAMEREFTAVKEAAEAANRAKSQFLATMSHELRTPMNGVLGITELIMATPLSDKQRQYLDMIMQSARSLTDILNDILDFSKIEAGKLTLEEAPFDVRETVHSVIGFFAALAQNKGLDLACVIDEAVPAQIVGDAGRLRQILANLVGNAVKFTTAGSVHVHVERPEQSDPTRAALRFTVRDTGLGIPAAKLDTIFESFTQVDNSSIRKHQGTGLGLAICRHLVERLMKGRIWVESTPGRGSVFAFETVFPVVCPLPEPAAPPDSGLAQGDEPRLNILLAEDNTISQMFATEILEQDGHRVMAANNGAVALKLLAQHPVDVVLMDIQMPEMDGMEATKRIRAGEVPGVPADLRIIAMTAHALKGDRERFLESGMNGYLSKPVSAESMKQALRAVMAGEAHQDAAQAEPAAMVLNEDWLLDKARGNREFLKKLFSVFIKKQPEKILEMRQALEAVDFQALVFAAHTLKGSSATMGAEQLKEAALGLENTAKARDLDQARLAMARLDEAFAQTMATIEAFNAR